MCEPATISMGLMIAGAASNAVGAYAGAKTSKRVGEYQSKVAAYNAQMDEYRAGDAISRGQTAVATQRLKTADIKGSQRARLAARGVALDEGSAFNILADTDFMGELDANTIGLNAEREAWALRSQAAMGRTNAQALRAHADAINPTQAAFSSLLSSGGSVASSWYRLNPGGGGGGGAPESSGQFGLGAGP